jgi:hypothetical protein
MMQSHAAKRDLSRNPETFQLSHHSTLLPRGERKGSLNKTKNSSRKKTLSSLEKMYQREPLKFSSLGGCLMVVRSLRYVFNVKAH